MTPPVNRAVAFVRQTSTITGISTILGTVTAVLQGQLTWQGALPLFAGAIVAIIMPGNSGAQSAAADASAALVKVEQNIVSPQAIAKAPAPAAAAPPVLMTAEQWEQAKSIANGQAPAVSAQPVPPAHPPLTDAQLAALHAILDRTQSAAPPPAQPGLTLITPAGQPNLSITPEPGAAPAAH